MWERTGSGLLSMFVCFFLFLLGAEKGCFCLCLGILSYLATSIYVLLLCFICFHTISSLERDSMSDQRKILLHYFYNWFHGTNGKNNAIGFFSDQSASRLHYSINLWADSLDFFFFVVS